MDRQRTLAWLRDWLDSREGQWIVWVRLSGRSRSWRVPWPEGRAEREEAWREIKGVLLGSKREGELHGRQAGAPRSQTTVIPWPGPADLFTDVEPAPVAPVTEVSQDATGALHVKLVLSASPPRKANRDCALAICRILFARQSRLTALDLTAAMLDSERDYCWSQSVIESSAKWLRDEGAIDNLRDGRGSGYGLLDWTVNPIRE